MFFPPHFLKLQDLPNDSLCKNQVSALTNGKMGNCSALLHPPPQQQVRRDALPTTAPVSHIGALPYISSTGGSSSCCCSSGTSTASGMGIGCTCRRSQSRQGALGGGWAIGSGATAHRRQTTCNSPSKHPTQYPRGTAGRSGGGGRHHSPGRGPAPFRGMRLRGAQGGVQRRFPTPFTAVGKGLAGDFWWLEGRRRGTEAMGRAQHAPQNGGAPLSGASPVSSLCPRDGAGAHEAARDCPLQGQHPWGNRLHSPTYHSIIGGRWSAHPRHTPPLTFLSDGVVGGPAQPPPPPPASEILC